MSDPLKITGLAVLVNCSDGRLRMVDLSGKQPKQVEGYVTHIQGGRLRVKSEALRLVAGRPAAHKAEPA